MGDYDQPLKPEHFDDAAIPEQKRIAGTKWASRLFNGFHRDALKVIRHSAFDESENPAYRIALLKAMVRWHEREAKRRREPRTHEVDVLIVSDLSLPGGTTSSNAADIMALRKAGLDVALFHHPNYNFDVARGVSAKIRSLAAEDGAVRIVDRHDKVRAKLTIVRFPPCMSHLVDTLPDVATERTVLVVNQAPYYYYGEAAPRRRSWRIPEVHDNLLAWLGDHTWYCASPTIRNILADHHADEMAAIDAADSYWFDITDPDQWGRHVAPGSRSGPLRIGRHARDSKLKWPSTAEDLLACYPSSSDFEVAVLGGATTPRKILGELPDNWVVHAFDEIDVSQFLEALDVMVYFLADSGIEAFGRSPMEAMAAGVPCVLDPRLEPTFGDAALYAQPQQVEQTLRSLADDPELYADMARRGLERVRSSFSDERLVRQVRALIAEATQASETPGGLLSRLRRRALPTSAGR